MGAGQDHPASRQPPSGGRDLAGCRELVGNMQNVVVRSSADRSTRRGFLERCKGRGPVHPGRSAQHGSQEHDPDRGTLSDRKRPVTPRVRSDEKSERKASQEEQVCDQVERCVKRPQASLMPPVQEVADNLDQHWGEVQSEGSLVLEPWPDHCNADSQAQGIWDEEPREPSEIMSPQEGHGEEQINGDHES